jgi:Fe/S biogenesis protein NfuA
MNAGQKPAISFTRAAVAKLNEVKQNNRHPVAGLRLQIVGRSGGEFQHVLSLVEDGAQVAGDLVVESSGIRVFIELRNARYVDGVEIDYEDRGPATSGLKYANPNPLWFDERELRIQEVFDREINPAIAAHGGYVNLLAVEGTTAFVELGGGCQGCGMADVTLKQGIEVAIREVAPEIERVIDQTDHAAGENPYFQPEKK